MKKFPRSRYSIKAGARAARKGFPFTRPRGKPTVTEVPEPINFFGEVCLTKSIDSVLQYCQEIRNKSELHKEVVLDFTGISQITIDALTIIWSTAVYWEKKNRRLFYFRADEKGELSKALTDSNHFNMIDTPAYDESTSKRLKAGTGWHRINFNNMLNLQEVYKTSFKESGIASQLKSTGLLYTFITEGIGNIKKHAYKENPNVIRSGLEYWLFHHRDQEDKSKYVVAFLDLGGGIGLSIKKQAKKQGFDIESLWGGKKLLQGLFHGKYRSATNDPNQGQGMPYMYEHAQEENTSLVSFSVMSGAERFVFKKRVDGDEESTEKLKFPFAGTYYQLVFQLEQTPEKTITFAD